MKFSVEELRLPVEFKEEKRSYLVGGSSHCITLPLDWCRYYGDRIDKLTVFGNGVLIIAPEGLEHVAEELFQIMKNTDKEVHHD